MVGLLPIELGENQDQSRLCRRPQAGRH